MLALLIAVQQFPAALVALSLSALLPARAVEPGGKAAVAAGARGLRGLGELRPSSSDGDAAARLDAARSSAALEGGGRARGSAVRGGAAAEGSLSVAAGVHRFDRDSCPACFLHEADAPLMFTEGRPDGFGNNVESLIYGMAIAAKHGYNYGGAIHYNHNSHRLDISKATAKFFGVAEESLFNTKIPEFDKQVGTIIDIQAYRNNRKWVDLNRTALVLFTATEPGSKISDRDRDEYLTPRFLDALQSQLRPHLLEVTNKSSIRVKAGAPLVAMHIRRGDVNFHLGERNPFHYSRGSQSRERWTPNEWYYEQVDRIRSLLPGADFHAWSSIRDKFDQPQMWANSTWFGGFRRRGILVHVDTDEVEAWAYMATADVFVMAKSSFSWVPAVLNPACVLYQPWGMKSIVRPIRSFVAAPYPTGPKQEDLAACVAKARQVELPAAPSGGPMA